MRTSFHLIEMIVGVILFGMAILHLSYQFQVLERLTEESLEEALAEGYLYQQYNNQPLDQVTEDELYALVMGYREYPIIIDDQLLDKYDLNYELFLELLREGYYKKEYVFDSNHKILQVAFTYIEST